MVEKSSQPCAYACAHVCQCTAMRKRRQYRTCHTTRTTKLLLTLASPPHFCSAAFSTDIFLPFTWMSKSGLSL